jgi:hypothetical protein
MAATDEPQFGARQPGQTLVLPGSEKIHLRRSTKALEQAYTERHPAMA